MFYFQARVEQSVPFLLLSTFSSYYDARGKTSRTDSVVIRKPMCPAGCPQNTRPACTQAQAGLTHHSPVPGVQVPVQTWTPSPHILSPGLSVVQGPPPPPLPISRSGKSQIRDKRATGLPCAHTQVCARDNNL